MRNRWRSKSGVLLALKQEAMKTERADVFPLGDMCSTAIFIFLPHGKPASPPQWNQPQLYLIIIALYTKESRQEMRLFSSSSLKCPTLTKATTTHIYDINVSVQDQSNAISATFITAGRQRQPSVLTLDLSGEKRIIFMCVFVCREIFRFLDRRA